MSCSAGKGSRRDVRTHATAHNPHAIDAPTNRAHVLWASARHDDAIAKATLCVERAPRFVNCRITLASALFEAGRVAQAQAEAE
jgi:hypothetical protein